MRLKLNRIAVFCGSSFGNDEIYNKKASELGLEMARRGLSLVYGGGNKGLMGKIAHTVYENGEEVIGVLPEALNIPAVLKDSVHTKLIVVKDMHERKSTMYKLSDGFVAMPGGIGTLEEIAEIYTWRQLSFHSSNIALYNVDGFWNPLVEQLRQMCQKGFMAKEVLDTLIIEDNASILLDRLEEKAKELPRKV